MQFSDRNDSHHQWREVKAVTTESSTTNDDALAYGESPDDGSSTKDVAKEQAAGVAGSAKDAGQHVAAVAKDQAGNVATEATRQAKDILGQTRAEITQQASDQQQRVAGGLRSLGTELGSMAEGSDESGVATDLARQASAKAHDLADWLEQRDPGSLLDEVKTFARRRPGAFLAIAVGAGLAAGRLTRGLKDEASSSSDEGTRSSGSAPTYATGEQFSSTGPYSTPTTGYSTPTTGYTPGTGEYATPATSQYSTSDEYGTQVAPAVEVLEPADLSGRQYPESGSPLGEERRP
jgi:gas vesicle protein